MLSTYLSYTPTFLSSLAYSVTTDTSSYSSDGKDTACNAGDQGLIPGLGRSLEEGSSNPLQCSCLENSMDKGSLVGYHPQGHKESQTTEELTHDHIDTVCVAH